MTVSAALVESSRMLPQDKVREGEALVARPVFLQAVADYRKSRGEFIYPDANSTLRITFGQVTIFSQHTTAAIKINEAEPLLLQDLARTLRQFAPPNAFYEHNDFSRRTVNMNEDECANGHAHCQHLFLSASETIPVIDGRLAMGQWQSIFLIELDHPRLRRVLVNVVGTA